MPQLNDESANTGCPDGCYWGQKTRGGLGFWVPQCKLCGRINWDEIAEQLDMIQQARQAELDRVTAERDQHAGNLGEARQNLADAMSAHRETADELITQRSDNAILKAQLKHQKDDFRRTLHEVMECAREAIERVEEERDGERNDNTMLRLRHLEPLRAELAKAKTLISILECDQPDGEEEDAAINALKALELNWPNLGQAPGYVEEVARGALFAAWEVNHRKRSEPQTQARYAVLVAVREWRRQWSLVQSRLDDNYSRQERDLFAAVDAWMALESTPAGEDFAEVADESLEIAEAAFPAQAEALAEREELAWHAGWAASSELSRGIIEAAYALYWTNPAEASMIARPDIFDAVLAVVGAVKAIRDSTPCPLCLGQGGDHTADCRFALGRAPSTPDEQIDKTTVNETWSPERVALFAGVRVAEVVKTAQAWVARTKEPGSSPVNLWGDEIDVALIVAVDALAATPTLESTPDSPEQPAKVLLVYADPELSTGDENEDETREPDYFAWDMAWGAKLTIRPDGTFYRVSLNISDDVKRNGVMVRTATRKQIETAIGALSLMVLDKRGGGPEQTAAEEWPAGHYMMATRASHVLGDVSRDEPDLAVVYSQDSDNYIGNWRTGFGYINVRFPKDSTRELTAQERVKYADKVVEAPGGFVEPALIGATMFRSGDQAHCARCGNGQCDRCFYCQQEFPANLRDIATAQRAAAAEGVDRAAAGGEQL